MVKWTIPSDKTKVLNFLGIYFLIYYQRFVKKFSSIASPLITLLEEKFDSSIRNYKYIMIACGKRKELKVITSNEIVVVRTYILNFLTH